MGKKSGENSHLYVVYFCRWNINFSSVSSGFFGCTKSFKKKKWSVDFIVQCVWLLEHVKLFSYYAKTHETELKAHGPNEDPPVFKPSSSRSIGGSGPPPRRSGICWKRRNLIIHACSKFAAQKKKKIFYRGTTWERLWSFWHWSCPPGHMRSLGFRKNCCKRQF